MRAKRLRSTTSNVIQRLYNLKKFLLHPFHNNFSGVQAIFTNQRPSVQRRWSLDINYILNYATKWHPTLVIFLPQSPPSFRLIVGIFAFMRSVSLFTNFRLDFLLCETRQEFELDLRRMWVVDATKRERANAIMQRD
jgi:hypothetical protein